MLHSRIMSLDSSGTDASGTVGVPPSRFAGAYYEFTDAAQTGDITITALGLAVLTKVGAANADGVQSIKPTDMDVVADDLVVSVANIANGAAGDKLAVRIFLDY